MQLNCHKWLPLKVFYGSSHAVDGKRVDSIYWSAFLARLDYRMKIGNGFGGGIARMQMWRGVKSAEEIAALAKAAHGRVVSEEAKKETP